MWADVPVTRETLDAYVSEATDNGLFNMAAPFSDDVIEALMELADAFPNSTPELVKAVYTAFDSPTSDI